MPDGYLHWPDTSPDFPGQVWCAEFSVVARRVPVHELTERCRSLGAGGAGSGAVVGGPGRGRARTGQVAATAAGGVVVMRCPSPDVLCKLAGRRRVIETGRKIISGGRYGDEGTGRIQHAWVVDPDRVRNFPGGAGVDPRRGVHVCAGRPQRRSPLPLPVGAGVAGDSAGRGLVDSGRDWSYF
ncbi:MAG TPA: hypothetical protein VK162_23025 [Streptosporangiaceae bacterium]|nr:hypothetical protein [Streptosporangiaceae bacterium]